MNHKLQTVATEWWRCDKYNRIPGEFEVDGEKETEFPVVGENTSTKEMLFICLCVMPDFVDDATGIEKITCW